MSRFEEYLEAVKSVVESKEINYAPFYVVVQSRLKDFLKDKGSYIKTDSFGNRYVGLPFFSGKLFLEFAENEEGEIVGYIVKKQKGKFKGGPYNTPESMAKAIQEYIIKFIKDNKLPSFK